MNAIFKDITKRIEEILARKWTQEKISLLTICNYAIWQKEIVVSLIVFCLNRNRKSYIACKKAFWNMLVKWSIIRVNLRFLNLFSSISSIIKIRNSLLIEQKMIKSTLLLDLLKILADHAIMIYFFPFIELLFICYDTCQYDCR